MNRKLRCGLLLIGVYATTHMTASAMVTGGLVAYYRMDSATVDSSGKGNDASAYGARFSPDRSGGANRAVFVDGNSWLEAADSLTLRLSGNLTIAAWINPASLRPADTPTCGIVSKPRSSTGTGYRLGLDGGKLNLGIYAVGYPWNVFSPSPLATQAWCHVAGVYDGNDMILYINGIEVARRSIGAVTLDQSSQPLFIGQEGITGAGHRFFNGSVDDVLIYNRALSATEVQQLAQDPGPVATALLSYQYDGSRGPQAITETHADSAGRFSFVFATTNVGARCLVSWTATLSEWFSLLGFDATTAGTEVSDTTPAPQTFYRTTYLPAGVSPADSFGYPIGSGDAIPEQITPERNDLYPNGTPGAVRGRDSGTGWHNAQDVGSYYSGNGLYHAGEDWNYGGGVDDVGRQIHAIANGIVMDISHLNKSSLESGGWALVIRHYLLNGDVCDSVYVHIAPPLVGDGITSNTNGDLGVEAWFPYQEGMPVPRGAVVAVVGAVQDYPTHLHFEVRNKRPITNLPISDGLAAVSNYWPNAVGTTTYYSDFAHMKTDGIVDPSDFIDDHR